MQMLAYQSLPQVTVVGERSRPSDPTVRLEAGHNTLQEGQADPSTTGEQ